MLGGRSDNLTIDAQLNRFCAEDEYFLDTLYAERRVDAVLGTR